MSNYPVLTIGHSTRSLDVFIELLQENHVAIVIDIRTIPRSRHNPQFNIENLPEALAKAGIEYQHWAGLGGLRHPRADSPNLGWRNESFRGFADYMQTAEFQSNLEALIKLAKEKIAALMCAESVPWRCHRSLIGDALTIRGITVADIIGPRNRRTHTLTAWARLNNGYVYYPPINLKKA